MNNQLYHQMKNSVKGLLILSTVIALSGCASMFADSLVYANRQPVIKTPADYGMEYEQVTIATPDDLSLNGWLIPGSADSLAVMVHPMNFSKYGYSVDHQGTFKITDIEVEFLKTAKSLNDAGHSVLTFDLRNHGESDSSADEIFGLGTLEWMDVIGALDYIESNGDLNQKQVFFVSFCTGANATILAMKNQPERFKDIRCMAAIQPISMEVFVSNFIAEEYPVFKGMVPDIEQSMIKSGGLPFSEMSPLTYIDGLYIPTLYVQAESDAWTDVQYLKSLYDATTAEKEFFWLKGELHRFDTYNYFGHSPERLLNFVNKYISE